VFNFKVSLAQQPPEGPHTGFHGGQSIAKRAREIVARYGTFNGSMAAELVAAALQGVTAGAFMLARRAVVPQLYLLAIVD
jgi:hypothetical protein